MLFLVHWGSRWEWETCYAELDACLAVAGLALPEGHVVYRRRIPPPSIHGDPFLIVDLPSVEAARAVFSRSVLARRVVQLWMGTAAHTLHDAVAAVAARPRHDPDDVATASWRLTVSVFGGHVHSDEAIESARNHFRGVLPFRGPVRLKDGACALPMVAVVDCGDNVPIPAPGLVGATPVIIPTVSSGAGADVGSAAGAAGAGVPPAATATSVPPPSAAAGVDTLWEGWLPPPPASNASWLPECGAGFITASHDGHWMGGGRDLCQTCMLCPTCDTPSGGGGGVGVGVKDNVRRVFVGLEIGATSRGVVETLSLTRRPYLGPTTLDPELGLFMTNLARVGPGDWVYDPFCGTGGVLVCASMLSKCIAFGSDIDYRVLKGKDGKAAATNFSHYHLPQPDIVRLDNAAPALTQRPRFEAIITDPPYGVRAGARKTGVPESKRLAPGELGEDAIPRTMVYGEYDVMHDLLDMAARNLVVGGRLVYLLPALYDHVRGAVPEHPCLTLEVDCEERMNLMMARRIVVMRKEVEYDPTRRGEYVAHSRQAAARNGLDEELKRRLAVVCDDFYTTHKDHAGNVVKRGVPLPLATGGGGEGAGAEGGAGGDGGGMRRAYVGGSRHQQKLYLKKMRRQEVRHHKLAEDGDTGSVGAASNVGSAGGAGEGDAAHRAVDHAAGSGSV